MSGNRHIAVKNMSMILDGQVLFDNVSFVVNQYEFVSVKGPSGCGKTTMLRILAGLAEPTGGKIFINGELANNPHIVIPPHKRGMNLLFQDLALWPHMKGRDQLKFVWESTRVRTLDERITTVCNAIGLPETLLSKYPSQLSRGEQQRLAIARTVISQPKILLFDEPLTALDQKLRKQFIQFLRQLKYEKQTTVIIVSHDLMTDVMDYDHEIIYTGTGFLNK